MWAQIWTSQLKRTVQTAKHLNGTVEQWKALNELEVVRLQPWYYLGINNIDNQVVVGGAWTMHVNKSEHLWGDLNTSN